MKRFILIIIMVLALTSIVSAKASEDEEFIYRNNIDDPSTIEEIQTASLLVSDDFDNDLTIYVVLDNYTGNETVLGEFIIVFGVIDSGGNETTIAITVINIDTTAPEFILNTENSLLIPQGSNLATNLPNISAIDRCEGDLTTSMIITGLDLVDTSILGDYVLTYSIIDSSGNSAAQDFTISIIDGTPPEIVGPSEILKRANYIIGEDFFMNYFSASDNLDGTITNQIELITNEYIGKANTPGTYEVVLSVTDTSGNTSSHILTIKVLSSMIPHLIIDNYTWVIPNNNLLTDSNYIDTLKLVGDLPNYTYIYTPTYDNYSGNFEQLGSYTKSFNLLSSVGTDYDRSINLHVVDAEQNIIVEEDSTLTKLIDHLWSWGWAYIVVTILGVGFFKK